MEVFSNLPCDPFLVNWLGNIQNVLGREIASKRSGRGLSVLVCKVVMSYNQSYAYLS